jgi:cell wall assembly regulator SMI1
MSISEMVTSIDALANKEYGRGASNSEISDAERSLGVQLPRSYKAFLSRFGWLETGSDILYGLGADVPPGCTLVRNTFSERYEAHPHIPPNLIPVMNDGAGNNYCLDTANFQGDECPVVFWDHEHDDGPGQLPERVARSFDKWLIDRIMNGPFADDA